MEKLEGLLKEKTRENKRQRENFDMLKSANDTLHKEVLSCHKTTLTCQHIAWLEAQTHCMMWYTDMLTNGRTWHTDMLTHW